MLYIFIFTSEWAQHIGKHIALTFVYNAYVYVCVLCYSSSDPWAGNSSVLIVYRIFIDFTIGFIIENRLTMTTEWDTFIYIEILLGNVFTPSGSWKDDLC